MGMKQKTYVYKGSDVLREMKQWRQERGRIGCGRGLCGTLWAISDKRGKPAGKAQACQRVADRISALLENQGYLEAWLEAKGIAYNLFEVEYWGNSKKADKLWNTRMAWLDWLIADFESRGD